jgi:arabinofuranosyltransferase
MNGAENSSKVLKLSGGVLILVFFVTLLRTAWISDDALITTRTVLNLLGGYGASFNIDERVQAYTHPLWFLILFLDLRFSRMCISLFFRSRFFFQ